MSKSRFLRNVSFLVMATVASRLIGIVTLPYKARLYVDIDYAHLAIFLVAATLITLLSTARFELIIPTIKQERDAMQMTYMIMLLSLVVCAIFSIVFYGIGSVGFGYELLTTELLGVPFIIALFAFCVLRAWTYTITYFFNHQERFRIIARSRLADALVATALGIGFGLLGTSEGLILALLLAAAIQFLFLVLPWLLHPAHQFPHVGSMIELAKTHIKQPLYNLPQAFFGQVQQNIFVGVIESIYGQSVLGFHAFTYNLVRMPSSFVGGALAEVSLKRAAKLLETDPAALVHYAKSFIKFVLVLLIIPVGILMFFGEPIFAFVFGEQWAEAGRYAQIYAPMIILLMMSTPLRVLPVVTGHQRGLMWRNMLMQVITYGTFAVLALSSLGFELALTTKVILESIGIVLIIWWIIKVCREIARASTSRLE